MNLSLQKTLNNQTASSTQLPMHKVCKVVVCVPIFNESEELVLKLLTSLAYQKKVSWNEYEVLLIVNNSKSHALSRTPEFLQNQKIISLVTLLQDKNNKSKIVAANKIIKSDLVVNVLDSSSLQVANDFNNVGRARDLGGREAYHRFLSTPAAENGIIAMTDADCRVSENYIYEIIETFKLPGVNAVSGKLLTEPDPLLPHKRLMAQAMSIHLKKETSFKKHQLINEKRPLKLQKKHKLEKLVINNGQNMSVRVRAFLDVNGFPHFNSMEDIIFGYKLLTLSGELAYNPNYWVVSLIRISERTGMTGLGRRVKQFAESIDDFVTGKSNALSIVDIDETKAIFYDIYNSLQNENLKFDSLSLILIKHKVNIDLIPKQDIYDLVTLINQGFKTGFTADSFTNIENLILGKFYEHFPKHILV